MGKPLRVLILQDSGADAGPLQQQLWRGGFRPEYAIVESVASLQGCLTRAHWDIVLCYQCWSSIPCTLAALKTRGLDLPLIVIIGGVAPLEEAIALMKSGVNDFIYADNLEGLTPAVKRALLEAERHRQAHAAVRESEQRYRTIFDTAPVGIWEWDLSIVKAAIDDLRAKGVTDFGHYFDANTSFIRWAAGQVKVLDVNATTLAMYGARDKEELQAALDRVLVSQTYYAFRDLLLAIAEGKAYFKGETVCQTLKDELLHVIVSLAIPTATSGFKNTLISVMDVTAHRQMEQALARSQQNFASVVVKNQSGIVITDRQGTALFSNPAAQTLLRRSAPELQGEQLGLPLVADSSAEIDIIRPGGGIAGIAEMSVTQTEWDGQPAYLVMLADVTERQRVEDERQLAEREILRHKEILEEIVRERTVELRLAKEAAEAANRAKSTFLANMSHELRTPLHSILSFARLGIKKHTLVPPEKRLHYFQKINESGETLLTLLNDLLDLAKLESGKSLFEFRPADVGMLIYKVIEEFRPLASERRIAMRFDRPPARRLVVLDKLKIVQVLRNLLSNAVKFSPDDGVIEISLHERDSAVQIALLDQGIGIPEDELRSVFDEFIQSSKTKTGAGGTGLGLAICQQIVAGHGGRIWAENNVDGGARFNFELPLGLREGDSFLIEPHDLDSPLGNPTSILAATPPPGDRKSSQ